MKKIILLLAILSTLNVASAQTYMKITQGTGYTLSPGNSIDEITFTPTFNCGDVILYGGESYPTVQIGTQCRMAKNMNIGTMILGYANQSDNGLIEKYCSENLEASCITYGGLYIWNEAMQYVTEEGAKGICPDGWHIPTLAEFQTLSTTVNGDANALKTIGQGQATGNNLSGFSALLAGSFNG